MVWWYLCMDQLCIRSGATFLMKNCVCIGNLGSSGYQNTEHRSSPCFPAFVGFLQETALHVKQKTRKQTAECHGLLCVCLWLVPSSSMPINACHESWTWTLTQWRSTKNDGSDARNYNSSLWDIRSVVPHSDMPVVIWCCNRWTCLCEPAPRADSWMCEFEKRWVGDDVKHPAVILWPRHTCRAPQYCSHQLMDKYQPLVGQLNAQVNAVLWESMESKSRGVPANHSGCSPCFRWFSIAFRHVGKLCTPVNPCQQRCQRNKPLF